MKHKSQETASILEKVNEEENKLEKGKDILRREKKRKIEDRAPPSIIYTIGVPESTNIFKYKNKKAEPVNKSHCTLLEQWKIKWTTL